MNQGSSQSFRSVVRTMALGICVAALLAYIGAAVFLYHMQDSLLYPGKDLESSDQPQNDPDLEISRLSLPFGEVETWFWPAIPGSTPGPGPAVIFAHGNGELIDHWRHGLDRFRALGLAIMLVEYPGYGRSGGSPSEESIRQTMTAAYDLLAQKPTTDGERIVGYGQSLGGGAICLLSRERSLAAVILQSTFTSTGPFAHRYLMPALLVRDSFDNLEAMRHFTGPVLVIHGLYDELIPHRQGELLAETASRGTLLSYDCGHWCWYPDRLPFWKDVSSFLSVNGI